MKDTLKSAKVYREENYYSYLAFKKFYNPFWSRVYFEWKGRGALYTEFSFMFKSYITGARKKLERTCLKL